MQNQFPSRLGWHARGGGSGFETPEGVAEYSPRRERGGWERFAGEQRQKRGAGGEGDALYTASPGR